jgi:hypothetical protein
MEHLESHTGRIENITSIIYLHQNKIAKKLRNVSHNHYLLIRTRLGTDFLSSPSHKNNGSRVETARARL